MKKLGPWIALAIAVSTLGHGAAVSQPGPETMSVEGERRCCEVKRGRWVTEPKTMFTRAACLALGEPGEFAPQGMPGASACMSPRQPPEDPVPQPPEEPVRPPPPKPPEERVPPVTTPGTPDKPHEEHRH